MTALKPAVRKRLAPGPMVGRLGLIGLAAIGFIYAAPASAAGSSMPWEAPLNSILESIQGPVAKVISVIIIIVTGLTLAVQRRGRRTP